MMFNSAETDTCRRLLALALAEDLGTLGDLTSKALIPPQKQGKAMVAARTPGVLAGLPAVEMVLAAVDPALQLQPQRRDGDRLAAGDAVAVIAGPLQGLLSAERTALNFLQHLSGVATLTRAYVDAIAGLPCQILDTRKTLPGWRLLEKYAVRAGGGTNHRMGLWDAMLIKDNHLATLGLEPTAVGEAVRLARRYAGPQVPLEVEVDTLEQLDAALAARPDMVLLDNMTPEQMREAVRRRNAVSPGVLLEASGGISLDSVRAIAETGVDRISVGALTHSAPALDLGLDYLP